MKCVAFRSSNLSMICANTVCTAWIIEHACVRTWSETWIHRSLIAHYWVSLRSNKTEIKRTSDLWLICISMKHLHALLFFVTSIGEIEMCITVGLRLIWMHSANVEASAGISLRDVWLLFLMTPKVVMHKLISITLSVATSWLISGL